jgi:hypothetical protein
MSSAQNLRAFKNKGKDVKLPVSGVTVKMRTVSLPELVKQGYLPAQLMSRALAGFPELTKEESSDPEAITQAMTDSVDFSFIILSSALIEPKLVREVKDEEKEVTLDDFEPEDVTHLMDVAQMSVNEYARFLRKSQERLHAVDDSEGSESETE